MQSPSARQPDRTSQKPQMRQSPQRQKLQKFPKGKALQKRQTSQLPQTLRKEQPQIGTMPSRRLRGGPSPRKPKPRRTRNRTQGVHRERSRKQEAKSRNSGLEKRSPRRILCNRTRSKAPAWSSRDGYALLISLSRLERFASVGRKASTGLSQWAASMAKGACTNSTTEIGGL